MGETGEARRLTKAERDMLLGRETKSAVSTEKDDFKGSLKVPGKTEPKGRRVQVQLSKAELECLLGKGDSER